jgi:hypothetical protein
LDQTPTNRRQSSDPVFFLNPLVLWKSCPTGLLSPVACR